jgi:hypothetical protein
MQNLCEKVKSELPATEHDTEAGQTELETDETGGSRRLKTTRKKQEHSNQVD